MQSIEKKYNICQKCILVDGSFGVEVNSDGLCSYCADPHFVTPTWKKVIVDENIKREKLADWNNTVSEMKKSHGDKEYCCVLGYSGGKDSTALVDTFINEYHLRPYLVSIDTGFMTYVGNKILKIH